MYERILLPTDGSDPAVRAQQHGRLLAERFDATIHLLTVTEDNSTGSERLSGAAEHLGDARWESATRSGRPAAEILRYADEADCDLIVMGTHGRRGLRRAVTGSVTERVIRRAEPPVFTVRGGDRETDPSAYERLCVPVDGSSRSQRALDPAISFAEAFDAAIDVISVVDVNTVAAQSELANPNVITGELREQAERAVERALERVESADLESHSAILQGTPSNAILDHVGEAGCDLIVMATHGRTGLERALIGSTTERTIRRADVPVVSVAASDE